MGGLAFADAGPNGLPLNIPRMSPQVYQKVVNSVHPVLQTIFHHVRIPLEVPQKVDHGDVDFLVMGFKLEGEATDSIKDHLKAQHHIGRGRSHSFAISLHRGDESFVQIDVEILPQTNGPQDIDLFNWAFFMKSYSDLLQIIGISHRSLGLTCNDRGLHVRIPEIESYDRKKSLLYLTSDPDQAMAFYGFDVDKYQEGFTSLEDIFQWVLNGRWFRRQNFERTEKASDRARLNKRPMYRKFVVEHMSMLRNPESSASTSREEILELALATFDTTEQYGNKMNEHRAQERNRALWRRLRDRLPLDGGSLSAVCKALQLWVDFEIGVPLVRETRRVSTEERPLWGRLDVDEELMLNWVSEHWEAIWAREKQHSAVAREAGKSTIRSS